MLANFMYVTLLKCYKTLIRDLVLLTCRYKEARKMNYKTNRVLLKSLAQHLLLLYSLERYGKGLNQNIILNMF